MRIAVLTAVALMSSPVAFAQDEAARRVATEIGARMPIEQSVKGAPYSAETIIEGNQALADGNRISKKTTGRVYRDSEGRTRREEDRPNGAMTISITDPVGGFSYSLDAVNKVAWRTPMGVGGAIMGKLEAAQASTTRRVYEERTNAEGQREVGFASTPMTDEDKRKIEAAAAARRAGAEDAQSAAVAGGGGGRGGGGATAGVAPAARAGGGGGRGGAVGGFARGSVTPATVGPLEHRTIEGVAVEGRKTTTVIPAGQIGNEQPITVTSEQWRSPELKVLVMTRHNDPRSGESTYRLQNIIRAEPDRSLFMVPADYTVKDTGIRRMLEASQRK
jgi:hypothetical protein